MRDYLDEATKSMAWFEYLFDSNYNKWGRKIVGCKTLLFIWYIGKYSLISQEILIQL